MSRARTRIAPPTSHGVRMSTRPRAVVGGRGGAGARRMARTGRRSRAGSRGTELRTVSPGSVAAAAAAAVAVAAGTISPRVPSDAGSRLSVRLARRGRVPAFALDRVARRGRRRRHDRARPCPGAARRPGPRAMSRTPRPTRRPAVQPTPRAPGSRIAGHDREALVVRQRVARQQPEVDPRGRHPRAVRQDDRDPRRVGSRGCARPPR